MTEWRQVRPKSRVVWAVRVLLAILIGTILTACGTTAPESTPSPPTGPTATVTVPVELPVTISITGSLDEEMLDVLDKQIMAFEAENPDIKVAILDAPPRDARRREAFSDLLSGGQTSPDIYIVDPTWLAEFAANDWLTDLEAYTSKYAVEIEDFFQPALEASSPDGRLVALPWFINGGLLYYRRDLLDAHGYEPPLSWPELQEAALDIKAAEGVPGGFVWQGAAYESLTCNTLEYVWAYGGDILDEHGNAVFDSAETRAGLQQMVDLIALGASPPEVAGYTEGATLADFQDGDAAMMRHWASAWPRLEGSDALLASEVGIAPLPDSCLSGLQLALSAHSLNPEQAFRFIAFLVRFPQQLQFALEAGQLPALDSVYQDAKLLAEKPAVRDLRDALSTARLRPLSPLYAEISEAIYTEVNAMLQGTQTVAATAASVQHRLEASAP